jgi:hypothetical protein
VAAVQQQAAAVAAARPDVVPAVALRDAVPAEQMWDAAAALPALALPDCRTWTALHSVDDA